MKRHPALIPFSHDHHDGLVHARRLRRAAGDAPEQLRDVAAAFIAFVDQDLEPHFRDEERLLDDVAELIEPSGVARLSPHLSRVRSEHGRLRDGWQRIRQELAADAPLDGEELHELGELLHDHIRFEERELFSTLQSVVPDRTLTSVAQRSAGDSARGTDADEQGEEGAPAGIAGALRADLKALGAARRGIPWSAASRDLNVTCLSWEPGHRIEAHRTTDRDILVIGIDGSGTVTVDGVEQAVQPGTIVLSPAGSERSIEAGSDGFVYVSMHRRREPMLPTRIGE